MGHFAHIAPRSCSSPKIPRGGELAPWPAQVDKSLMAGKIIASLAVLSVVVVLCMGLYTLWLGGTAARTWSNKLMRIRVLAQFIAILIIIAVAYFNGNLNF